MASDQAQALPADLLHLLSQQLSLDQDFSTLYNFVISSKQLAGAGAVSALYRYAPNSLQSDASLTITQH